MCKSHRGQQWARLKLSNALLWGGLNRNQTSVSCLPKSCIGLFKLLFVCLVFFFFLFPSSPLSLLTLSFWMNKIHASKMFLLPSTLWNFLAWYRSSLMIARYFKSDKIPVIIFQQTAGSRGRTACVTAHPQVCMLQDSHVIPAGWKMLTGTHTFGFDCRQWIFLSSC